MSRSALAALALLSSLVVHSVAWAASTPEDAKSLVKKAVALVKASGKDKALAEFNNSKGAFVQNNGELYIFVIDQAGKTLANGANAKLVGKNVHDLRDVDGRYFIRDMIDIATSKGEGWTDYKWNNAATNTMQMKSTYFEKVDDIIVGCGVYK